jgi:hypothetical protein
MVHRRSVVYTAVALLALAAVSCCRASPPHLSSFPCHALDSATSFDGPFDAFAGERHLVAPGFKTNSLRGNEAAEVHGRPLRAPAHWRSLAFANSHDAGLVEAAAVVPSRSIMAVAEEVFDRVSVAGGVLVMGLSMVLP